MTRSNSTQPQAEKNRPQYEMHYVVERGGQSYWTKLSGLWPNEKGNGFNSGKIHYFGEPGGRFVIVPPRQADDDAQPQHPDEIPY